MATSTARDCTPQEAIVGPYQYGIDFDGDTAYDYQFLGVCLDRSRRLRLDPRQSDTEISQTLLHEIIHALGSVYRIDEWGKHKIENDKVVDKIDLMAPALLMLLWSSPAIVRWL